MTRHRLRALLVAAALPVAALPVLAGPAWADEVYERPANGIFALEGHGWGHGHGMSQWGAYGAATLGRSADYITSFYYPNTSAATIPNSLISVKLTRDEGIDVQVRAAAGLRAGDLSRSTARIALPAGPTDWRARIVPGGQQLQYKNAAGAYVPYPITGQTTVAGPIVFYGPPTIRVVFPDSTSADYRRSVQAKLVGSSLYALAVMPIEDYLRGVVPRESPASWSAAALQAQAIAARTYAAFEKQAHASSSYDICDSTMCQVFGGTAFYNSSGTKLYGEDARTDAAIAATAGKIRAYGGAPIFAQFSSSDGGYTTDGGKPYLTAHPDPYDGVIPNSAHYWTTGLPASYLERRHTSVGTLLRIRVLSRDGRGEWGGRVLSARLEGTRGSVDVPGSELYYACPYGACSYGGMKSSWWHGKVSPPSAPQHVTAVGQDQKVLVDWDPPASSGGAAISSYTVTASPGGRSVTVPAASTSATVYGLPSGTTYRLSVVARSSGGSSPATTSAPVAPGWVFGDLYPLTPTRVLDTRLAGRTVTAGHEVAVKVDGVAGIPTGGVNAVAVNVTVVEPSASGYATVYGTGEPRPLASTLTFPAGRTTASGSPARVGVGPGGYVSVYVAGANAHVVVDVIGYYRVGTPSARGLRYVPVPARRVADTRADPPGVLDPGEAIQLEVGSRAPAGATAAVLNLTAISPTATTWLTMWRSGTGRPRTSNLNVDPGDTRANTAVVPLGAGGLVSLYNNSGQVAAAVDVLGYFVPYSATSQGRYAAALPIRVLDTRTSTPVGRGRTVSFRVTGVPGVPHSGVRAVAVALTAVQPTSRTWLVAYPAGASLPDVSSVNVAAGTNATNVVVVPVSATGTVSVRNAAGTTHVVADVVGWYTG